MHDPCVDTRHDERRNPATGGFVICDLHIRLHNRELMLWWAQAVRVLEFAPQIGVAYGFLHHIDHARDGSAGRATLHADYPHVDPCTCLAELFQGVAL